MGRVRGFLSFIFGKTGTYPRLRLLFWATLLGLIFGVLQVGQPLEDAFRTGRNLLRKHKASGDIVIVGIDDKSLEVANWPWPRRYEAALVNRLNELGARRIFFDIDFPSASNPKDDAAFAAALAKSDPPVTLAIRFIVDPATGLRTETFPIPEFRRHASLAHINFRVNYQGAAWKLFYGLKFHDKAYPSMASAIAGSHGKPSETFPIDYSIDPLSIPTLSAADIVNGNDLARQVAGKDVIIGTTTYQLGDTLLLPGYDRLPGVYVHALGAETLKAGSPVQTGWLIPFLVSFLIVAGCLLVRNMRLAVGLLTGAVIVALLLPLVLESNLIFSDTVPALFLMTSIAGSLGWTNFRNRVRGTINAVSGLPNLNALRQEKPGHGRPLIAVRIQNYAEITSSLPPEQEKALVEQIASRLTVGASHSKLYQGDEGIFAWFAEQSMMAIGDHLDALHALFRSPIVVGDNQIDLTLSFGLDSGIDRSPVNRIASALVAADEAASAGAKWKVYDTSRLKDAAWKLSLLSQLDTAIENGELWVAYQPKLDLASQRIVGAEALVRWTHPEKGPISPMEFILAAEQHDRIEKLTAFVLDRAIGAAAAINARDIPFEISVNLSARLINHDTLADGVEKLLIKHGLAPSLLTLEVTETAALATGGSDLEKLNELRDLGVKISIDDYGTGLSTLDYLKRIPATEIKIDKSFVQAIDKSQSDRLLVHSTIQLAHSMGRIVVAEGVEDAETLEMLVKMGCDVAQGYWIGRPAPFRSFTKQLLVKGDRKVA